MSCEERAKIENRCANKQRKAKKVRQPKFEDEKRERRIKICKNQSDCLQKGRRGIQSKEHSPPPARFFFGRGKPQPGKCTTREQREDKETRRAANFFSC